jgi:hypothetical protein
MPLRKNCAGACNLRFHRTKDFHHLAGAGGRESHPDDEVFNCVAGVIDLELVKQIVTERVTGELGRHLKRVYVHDQNDIVGVVGIEKGKHVCDIALGNPINGWSVPMIGRAR